MKLGNLDISTVKLGASQVQAIYQGPNLVWQNAPVATAATGVGQTSFTANWNAYTGAVYYLLDVSTSSSFTTFVYENQVTTSTSYVVIGLNPNTTYYYRVRASTEYDADAQAFFDRVTTAGGTLSTTEKAGVDILVGQMKDDGIWTKMKAIYPMVGASAASCAQNLKSSSFTGTFTSGWTFASTGATPNGTSAYMDTGVKDSTLASVSFGVYSRTQINADSSVIIGYRYNSSSYGSHIFPRFTGDLYKSRCQDFSSGGNDVTSFTNTQGFYQISRTNTSNYKAFFNNNISQSFNQLADVSSINTFNYYLAARNDQGIGASNYNANEQAFAYIGDGLTDTEASDFYTAVQAFQTTLNRQVS